MNEENKEDNKTDLSVYDICEKIRNNPNAKRVEVEIEEGQPKQQLGIDDICKPLVTGILALCIFGAGFLIGRNIPKKQDVYIPTETTTTIETTVETIPETEVIETTACTTAPDKESLTPIEDVTETTTSIPETEESIHITPTETPSKPSPEPSTPPVSGETNTNAPQSDLEMLACVIYQEAGGNGSCDNCRRYVADIVLNRVADSRFPDTIHGVLTAPSQYGRFHWTGVVWPSRANNASEQQAVERAYRIAGEVLNGQHSELYGNGYVWQAGFAQGSDGFWCCGHFYGRG